MSYVLLGDHTFLLKYTLDVALQKYRNKLCLYSEHSKSTKTQTEFGNNMTMNAPKPDLRFCSRWLSRVRTLIGLVSLFHSDIRI